MGILKNKLRTLMVLAFLCLAHLTVSAFTGSDLASGQKYYLFNIYQSKFLGADNKLQAPNVGTPVAFEATANGFTISGTAYTATKNAAGYYQLKNGVQFFAFEDKVADPENPDDENRAMYLGGGVTCQNTTNDTDRSYWQLISETEYEEWQAKKKFTVASLNVDGMPKSITLINLNPDGKEGPGATAIGKKLANTGWDIVGVSEDFNFHKELIAEIEDKYDIGSHRGVLEYSAGLVTKFISQKTLFNTDGLCFFTKKNSALMQGENWYAWENHNGYSDSGADGLIAKGYRYYKVRINDEITVDVYTMHMDADSNEGDIEARHKQMQQLVAAIKASNNKRPIIIIGDMNSRYTRENLKAFVIDELNNDERFTVKDAWVECALGGNYPERVTPWDANNDLNAKIYGYRQGEVVDKIIYINNSESPVQLLAETYRQDLSFVNEEGSPLCDHKPCVVTFSYEGVSEEDNSEYAYKWVGEKLEDGKTYYVYNVGAGRFLKSNSAVADNAQANTWTVTYDGTNVRLYNDADGKTLYAKRSTFGLFINYSIEYDNSNNTLETNNATTSKQGVDYLGIGYKLHGSDNRYLNVENENSTKLSSAKTAGKWNDWLFISTEQFEAKQPKDWVENEVHYYSGIYQSQPNVTLQKQDAENALDIDISKANIVVNGEINVEDYQNAIIYANKDSKVTNAKNVVIDGVSENVVFVEGAPVYVPKAFTAKDANYSRNIKNKWGTIIFPTRLLSNANGNGVQYYQLVEKSDDEAILFFEDVNELAANTPGAFIVDAADGTNANAISFIDGFAQINETDDNASVTTGVEGWTMVGIYRNKVIDTTADNEKTYYYISSDHFYNATGLTELKGAPFRSFFTTPKGSAAKVFSIALKSDNATTGVEKVEKPAAQIAIFGGIGQITVAAVSGASNVNIYTMSGMKVAQMSLNEGDSQTLSLANGVYIVNGVKVLVK